MGLLSEMYELSPIPVVGVDPDKLEFIDAIPANLVDTREAFRHVVFSLLGDATTVTPPSDSDVIAAGSATLTIPGTTDTDLIGLVFQYTANFNVSTDIMAITLSVQDERGATFQQTINLRPIATSGRAIILFSTASQDVAHLMRVKNGYIATITTAPTFSTVSISFTVACNSNGATVSIIGVNNKHVEFLDFMRSKSA